MQKKLLLLFVAINSVMIQANELEKALAGEGQKTEFILENDKKKEEISEELSQELADYENQKNLLHKTRLIKDELADYEKQKTILYTAALFNALSNKTTAINELTVENEKEYKLEEEKSRKLQDDSVLGWGGAPATKKTINGRISSYIGERRAGKAKINAKLSQTFNGYVHTFNTSVMSILEGEVIHKNYEIERTFLEGLDKCGDNQECLLEGNVYLPVIMQEGFFDRFNFAAFKPVIKAVKEKDIPLTDEQIITIAKMKVFQRGTRELSVATLEESKKKVVTKLNDLLHPKKNDEVIFDEYLEDDQNSQGDLST